MLRYQYYVVMRKERKGFAFRRNALCSMHHSVVPPIAQERYERILKAAGVPLNESIIVIMQAVSIHSCKLIQEYINISGSALSIACGQSEYGF